MIKFTVITVTKNAAASLERCFVSVARQTYPLVEYIVVDGASSDGTQAIVKRHRKMISRYISEPDSGIYNAMNKGLGHASGDFIYFLGADDYLVDKTVLQDVAAFLDCHPNCGFAYGSISVRRADGSQHIYVPPPPEEALEFLVYGCLPHQASFTSRQTFNLVGAFDEQYRIGGDYEWFLRVVAQRQVVKKRFERVVASYYSDGRSNDLERSQQEAYAIQNAFPPYQTAPWMERRISLLQRELLRSRIECNSLRQQLQNVSLLAVLRRFLLRCARNLPSVVTRYLSRWLPQSRL